MNGNIEDTGEVNPSPEDPITTETQTLSEDNALLLAKLDEQNALIVETNITLILTIVIVAAVKIFVDQISRW